MKSKLVRKNSIYVKFILPLMAVLIVLDIVVFSVIFFYSGNRLNRYASDNFDNQVAARKNYIQNEMLKSWSNIYLDAAECEQTAEAVASACGQTAAQALADKETVVDILDALSEKLFFLLRKNNVNDVFLVLDTSFFEDRKYAVYLRDRNPLSQQADNLDVLIEIAPTAVRDRFYAMGLDKSTQYETMYDFSEASGAKDFFSKPLAAARQYPTIGKQNAGYWSPDLYPHSTREGDSAAISFSVPLSSADGTLLGVLGIGMLVDYIQKYQLPLSDFGEDMGNYVLIKTDAQNDFGTRVAYNFSDLSPADYDGADKFFDTETARYGLQSEKTRYAVSYAPLTLYGNNTPFAAENWVLAGIVSEKILFDFIQTFSNFVIILTVAMLVLSFVVFTFVSYRMTLPAIKLTRVIERQKHEKIASVKFEKTHIYEIDTLVNEIDSLLDNMLEFPQKLTRILAMTHLPAAAFEYIADRDYFYHTDGLNEFIGLDPDKEITQEIFAEQLNANSEKVVERERSEDGVLKVVFDFSAIKPRFIEVAVVCEQMNYSGVVRDITEEKLERKKLEYERDMDALTPLKNRKGFERELGELFGKTHGLSALLMMDLDNLKRYNDRYGHETGDRVIKTVGEALMRCCGENCIGSHVSGDEFLLYFYGFERYEDLSAQIEKVRRELKALYLVLDADRKLKITVSGGYAVCPRDTDNLNLLQSYADFALYEAKNERGRFMDFNAQRYASDEERQRNRRLLEEFLDNQTARFVFQPIVDLKNAQIFGYEALIRPTAEGIDTPTGLLQLAKENNRLGDIERLTLFGSAAAFTASGGEASGAKLFVNTISSQIVSSEDLHAFETRYRSLLPKIVMEFTETEFMNDAVYRQRQQILKKWHARCALDDYGIGYSNFSMLVRKSIHFVKIDRLLLQDIHIHPNKKEIVYSLVKYCHSRNIGVIAEGIEKKEELEVMLQFGADYAQGFYLAMPREGLGAITDEARRTILGARTGGDPVPPTEG